MRYVSPRPNSPVFWSPELKNRTTRSQTYKMLGFGDISSIQRGSAWEIRSIPGVGRPEQKSLLGRFAEHTKSVIDLS
jgi:hypothetical protein